MKKISFVIAACTLFVFAACGGNDAAAEETVDTAAAVEAPVEEAPVEEATADTAAAEAPVAEEAAAE